MIRMPNMLMAGAAGRNLGKTQFLCQAIRAQSTDSPVIGIKVTAFDDVEGEVQADRLLTRTYRTIEGDYVVTREKPGDDNKDTHRMYHAGAERVYWLRAKRSHLEEGLNALLKTMDADGIDLENACIVCESGGARNYIVPGLFFIIRERDDELKPSCAQVAHLADRLVNVDGNGWDIRPEDLIFKNARWGLKENAAAIVLSGGASQRMGEDKAAMDVSGRPLLSRITAQLAPNFKTVLISGKIDRHNFTAHQVVEDIEPGRGPLMGLLSALKESDCELNFVTTCDAPEVHMPLVRQMLNWMDDYDAVVPVFTEHRQQPLFAVYRRSVITTVEALLAEGKQAMFALLDHLNVHYVEVDADWYENLNTPGDVVRYGKSLS